MPETNATIELTADDAAPTSARTMVTVFSAPQRARRAAVVLLVGLAAAAALIPIPIIHLLGIPLAIITAGVLAVKQLRTGARIAAVSLPCPKCGAPQLIGGGLGVQSIAEPIARSCDSCRRGLQLRVERDVP